MINDPDGLGDAGHSGDFNGANKYAIDTAFARANAAAANLPPINLQRDTDDTTKALVDQAWEAHPLAEKILPADESVLVVPSPPPAPRFQAARTPHADARTNFQYKPWERRFIPKPLALVNGEVPKTSKVGEWSSTNRKFLSSLDRFFIFRGECLGREPIISSMPLDLYVLYSKVDQAGGYEAVTRDKSGWSDLYASLPNYSPTNTSAAYNLKKMYQKYLLNYSRFFSALDLRGVHVNPKLRKSDVPQQMSDGTFGAPIGKPIPFDAASASARRIISEGSAGGGDFQKSFMYALDTDEPSLFDTPAVPSATVARQSERGTSNGSSIQGRAMPSPEKPRMSPHIGVQGLSSSPQKTDSTLAQMNSSGAAGQMSAVNPSANPSSTASTSSPMGGVQQGNLAHGQFSSKEPSMALAEAIDVFGMPKELSHFVEEADDFAEARDAPDASSVLRRPKKFYLRGYSLL